MSRIQPDVVLSRLAELDLLIPELTTSFESQPLGEGAEDGLSTLMVQRFNGRSPQWIHRSSVAGEDGSLVDVDVALAVSNRAGPEKMLLYCNFREVTEESAIHQAIRRTVLSGGSEPVSGLNVVVNMRMLMPQFSGPTKGRLDDPVAAEAVVVAVQELLAANGDARQALEALGH